MTATVAREGTEALVVEKAVVTGVVRLVKVSVVVMAAQLEAMEEPVA